MKHREELGKMIQKITSIPLPNMSVMRLIDYEVITYVSLPHSCFPECGLQTDLKKMLSRALLVMSG